MSRWALCLFIILVLDTYCFWEIKSRLLEVFIPHGIPFLLFTASIAAGTSLIRIRAGKRSDYRDQAAVWGLGICVIGLVYVLLIYSFSYGIYPQISANRGGGDFTDTPHIVIYFGGKKAQYVPAEISKEGRSQELVLIDESEQHVLVADPTDMGGPKEWRSGNTRPQVYEVERSAIAGFTYLSRLNNGEDATKKE